MVEYDHWNWTCSRNNQDWESNSNIMEPRFDTQLQDQIAVLNEIFAQDIEMITQEESFANAQRMTEESTNQVMKEMVFDDDYDLNGLNHQELEGDSSCKNLSWEYEPLEDVESHYEEKEPFKVVLGQTLTKLDYHLYTPDSRLLNQEISI